MRGFDWNKHPECVEYLMQIYKGRLFEETARMMSEHFGIEFRRAQIRGYLHNRKMSSGLTKSKKGIRYVWTEEADRMLEELKDVPNDQTAVRISELLGKPITPEAVGHRKNRLGIHSINTGKFEKGHIPEYGYEKGHRPDSWLPVGTEVERGGYIYIKVSDMQYANQWDNWRRKQVYIWEQNNGPVPKGMNVIFLDGNRKNYDISNLMLVSDAELGHMCKTQRTDREIIRGKVLVYRLDKKIEEIRG